MGGARPYLGFLQDFIRSKLSPNLLRGILKGVSPFGKRHAAVG